MFFEQIKKLNNKDFTRATGIKPSVFIKMAKILKEAEAEQKYYGGRRNIYSIEDRLTMTLKYWKEYPTFFQMSLTYKISASSCYRNIVWVENNLAKHPDFKLAIQDKNLDQEAKNDTLIIDATDIPVERPKKNYK